MNKDIPYIDSMFTTTRPKLLRGLLRLRRNICGYTGPPCDCKYGYKDGTREQTGCPEIANAAALIARLRPSEYEEILNRPLPEDIEEYVEEVE